ncbi:MAG: hypothetical protein RI985_683 [Chloroflexota bacterium]|jgi:hypothetical protein
MTCLAATCPLYLPLCVAAPLRELQLTSDEFAQININNNPILQNYTLAANSAFTHMHQSLMDTLIVAQISLQISTS